MPELLAQAQRWLYEEAMLLDGQRWDAWLECLHENVVYWVPAWRDSRHLTDAPEREVSLIYCAGRQALIDRVQRITSGQSPATTPMPRTVHSVTNVMVEAASDEEVRTRSTFFTLLYDLRRGEPHIFAGHYEHTFQREAPNGRWLIARKRVVLANDRIPGMLDFYSV